jgi:hypothetical protein
MVVGIAQILPAIDHRAQKDASRTLFDLTPPRTVTGSRQACRLDAFEVQSPTRDRLLKEISIVNKNAPLKACGTSPNRGATFCDN